jgi:uncharacterized protein (TIGR03435 family)
MRAFTGLLLSVAATLFAQSPAKVEFEVASVKPMEATADPSMQAGVHVDGSQVHLTHMSMKDLVRVAFRVKFYEVAGPEWMAGERYDISAKIPENATREQVPAMLHALLEERFQLKAHRESKEVPVYGLVPVAGGAKLKEVPDDPADEPGKAFEIKAQGGPGGVSITYGPGSYFKFGDNKIEGRKLNMTNFVDVLGRFVDRPVIDMTGLTKRYDLDVQLTDNDYNAMLIRSALAAGVNLPPQALRLLDSADGSLGFALKPLGLKLESKKAPMEVVVVDSVLKVPTAN